ncbi:hypothetical protein NDU88_005403 [Pleurodeles waltl]|uniref:Uncharacterized protein n=1 Tax=Pleurodeles waltl TaxID=8319 RepID=A0AAV7W7Q4_PLEWA|nr:hypothetical protein NDU88_005403 [Pleurodeles waltl]
MLRYSVCLNSMPAAQREKQSAKASLFACSETYTPADHPLYHFPWRNTESSRPPPWAEGGVCHLPRAARSVRDARCSPGLSACYNPLQIRPDANLPMCLDSSWTRGLPARLPFADSIKRGRLTALEQN